MKQERRQHRRLAIRLPLECYPEDSGPEQAVRTVTGNISTGGLYFELDLLDERVPAPQVHSMVNVEMTVPPGDGHFPYEGRVRTAAEVVRCDRLAGAVNRQPAAPPRVGIGARFREPLHLSF